MSPNVLASRGTGGMPSSDPRPQTADLLNTVIATAAADHGFQFVDVTSRFDGHGANAPAAWILGSGDAAFHPNLHSYRAYAAALTSQITPTSLQ